MSGRFDKADKEWIASSLKQGNINKLDEALIETSFDQQTDYDISSITKKMIKEKYIKKLCLLKMLTSPMDIALITLVFGIDKAKDKIKVTKSYYAYWKGTLSLTVLQNRLQSSAEEGTIL